MPISNTAVITQSRFSAYRQFFREPLGVLGLVLVVLLGLGAILAPYLTDYSPNAIDIKTRLAPPSSEHWLGADHLGRDTFTRVLYGGRVALKVAAWSISLALLGGLLLGMIAGYGPRWLDNLLILIFDAVRSFPTIMLALAIITLTGPSLNMVILVIVITSIPVYARIVRAQTMSLRESEFVFAARSIGTGWFRMLYLHILPNVIGPLLILASMDIPVVVTIESGLSFLGLGVRPPTASWGTVLADGYAYVRNTPWLLVAGGVPLILTTLGFTFMGETLRDIFDPTLKRRD
ncbi:MAG: ABC transporter permease [Arenicellales bacterium]|nr:ABC transporter permease [Arenicellales bacterium]MDP7517197.1 ABC transporter permease [Arenicellales bacterium]